MAQQSSLPSVAPKRRLRRWLAAILLGLLTSCGVSCWLEPRPVWQLPYSYDHEHYSLLCENEAGTLAAMSYVTFDNNRNEAHAIRILNAHNGEVLYHLDQEWNKAHEEHKGSEHFRIIGKTLWRFSIYQYAVFKSHELQAWEFAKDSKERLINVWLNLAGTTINIAFAASQSPYFVVRSEWPWQPGMTTLLAGGWAGLINHLALHNARDIFMTALIPLMRTYELPSQAGQPRLIASWTLPPMRWNRSWGMGIDARWVVFSDTHVASHWKQAGSEGKVKQPPVLLYDGHTGQQRAFDNAHPGQTVALKEGVWRDLVRLSESSSDIPTYRVYDGRDGKVVPWPSALPAPFSLADIFPDSIDPDQGIYQENGQLYHIHWTGSSIEGFRIPIREKQQVIESPESEEAQQLEETRDLLQNDGPSFLLGRHLIYQNRIHDRPQLIHWLDEHWKKMPKWLHEMWPTERQALQFFDIHSGKQVWQIKDANAEHPQKSNHHLYTNQVKPDISEDDQTTTGFLKAWSLPFQCYSIWWARIAGLLISLCILFLRPRLIRRTAS